MAVHDQTLHCASEGFPDASFMLCKAGLYSNAVPPPPPISYLNQLTDSNFCVNFLTLEATETYFLIGPVGKMWDRCSTRVT
jgi:hypothetical protein